MVYLAQINTTWGRDEADDSGVRLFSSKERAISYLRGALVLDHHAHGWGTIWEQEPDRMGTHRCVLDIWKFDGEFEEVPADQYDKAGL